MSGKDYDLAIIGSGPGGYVAAIRAGQLGLRTAIIEKDKRMGGTCLNVGCIPTKALLHNAEIYHTIKHAKDYGITVSDPALDMNEVHRRKDKIVLKNAKGIEYLMAKHKVDIVRGFAVIEKPGSLVVKDGGNETAVRAKNTLLATGSSVKALPGIAFDGKVILSSDDILSLREIPKHLVVVGAGAVGVEFASVYVRFGSQVTLVELLDRIVPLEDADVSAALQKNFVKQGMTVHTGARLESVVPGQGGARVTVKLATGESKAIDASHVLIAAGRKPNTAGIGLENTRVKVDRGFLPVGPRGQTDEPGIWAIGDIVPTPALAHVASAEGKLVVETIAGLDSPTIDYDQIPSCTYCEPQVASVGLTEAEARKRGHDVKIGKFATSILAKAQMVGDTDGFVKIVADKTYGELLGFHIYGHLATEMLNEGTVAMHLEDTDEDFSRIIHPHPTLSESVHEAAMALLGHPIHG
ncbi:MAG: dihydrolipoyl dehydrogenase [Acidobacteriota bacterium]